MWPQFDQAEEQIWLFYILSLLVTAVTYLYQQHDVTTFGVA